MNKENYSNSSAQDTSHTQKMLKLKDALKNNKFLQAFKKLTKHEQDK